MHVPANLRRHLVFEYTFDWRCGDTARIIQRAPNVGPGLTAITQASPWQVGTGGRYVQLVDADCDINTGLATQLLSAGTLAYYYSPVAYGAGANPLFSEAVISYTVRSRTVDDVTLHLTRDLAVEGKKYLSATVAVGNWYFVVLDWGNAGTRLFVDGRLVASDATVAANDTASGNTQRIGSSVGAYGDNHLGFFAFWDRQIGDAVNWQVPRTRRRAA
jgi:hypothetical protein